MSLPTRHRGTQILRRAPALSTKSPVSGLSAAAGACLCTEIVHTYCASMTTSSATFHVDGPGLRVLAHPVRARLLAELRGAGPATATGLAARLRTNSGATSYHLRKLAEVGLVVDTGEGTGRQRVWAVNPGGSPRPEVEDDGGDDAALDWLARDYVQHFSEKAQDWLQTRGDWPAEWQEQVGLEDHLVLVTPAQLQALRAEMHDLLERYRRVGAGNPQAKRVSVYTCPLPVDPPPRP